MLHNASPSVLPCAKILVPLLSKTGNQYPVLPETKDNINPYVSVSSSAVLHVRPLQKKHHIRQTVPLQLTWLAKSTNCGEKVNKCERQRIGVYMCLRVKCIPWNIATCCTLMDALPILLPSINVELKNETKALHAYLCALAPRHTKCLLCRLLERFITVVSVTRWRSNQ